MKETPLMRDYLEAISGPKEDHNFEAEWKNTWIEVQLLSDVGRKRQNNEDACLFFAPQEDSALDGRGMLVAVADGMGGASAGEYASRKSLECLCARYYDKDLHTLTPNAMKLAVELANETIFEEAELNSEYSGMGTTISALAIVGNWAYIAQVGDSRVYLLRPNSPLRQLTNDHSLVAEQIRNGLLNEEEARNHSLKNLITRAVGIKEYVDVDLFAVQLHPGDTLLLCSDGLSNMVSDAEIADIMSGENLQELTRSLRDHALEAGGHDNVTTVTMRLIASPPLSHYQQGAKIVNFEQPSFFSRLRNVFTRQ
jgi:protein phosphatase